MQLHEVIALVLAVVGLAGLAANWVSALRKAFASGAGFFAGAVEFWGGAFFALVLWAIALTVWFS